MPAAADVRKLADRLAARSGSGAKLTAESAHLAMVALRVYADLLEQPAIDDLGAPYKIETLNSSGDTDEIMSLCRNILVAQAAFEEGVKQRPGRDLRLRKGAHVLRMIEQPRGA
jgi:hypothetical protein